VLAQIESSINRYLADDPRWGVFLLHRIGHHEWVPEGTESTTHVLDATWEGTWMLERETRDWTSPMKSAVGRAAIKHSGDYFEISVAADQPEEPFPNVEDCVLRYSGGSTFLPEPGTDVQKATGTFLGSFYPSGRAAWCWRISRRTARSRS
jgi:hypothetical protein